MKYSLINVVREYEGMVDGVWMQDHIGTIESASEAARATERANSNRITVAVVEDLGLSCPDYSYRTSLKRLDKVQELSINNVSDVSIHFIEKEPWKNNARHIGGCDMFPTYMVKNGQEYFMFNRPSNQAKYENDADEARKKQLLDNGGKFFKFNGYKDTPTEYLRAVIEKEHSFTKTFHEEVEWSDDGKYCDFHGNLKEVSAAFNYRIYDKELAEKIEKVVGLIKEKKYKEALMVLNEYDSIKQDTPSLLEQIESASTRSAQTLTNSNTKIKKSEHEL